MADGADEIGKGQSDIREDGLRRGDVRGISCGGQQRAQLQILERCDVERSTSAIPGTGQELADAGGIRGAQRHIGRE